MSNLTITEASELAGVSEGTLRQHITRGKLASLKVAGRTVVDEDALHAYMIAEGLEEAAVVSKAQPVEEIAAAVNEIPLHVLIGRLPADGQAALLEGMRTGSPEPYRKWLAQHKAEMAGRRTVPIDEIPYAPKKAIGMPKGRPRSTATEDVTE